MNDDNEVHECGFKYVLIGKICCEVVDYICLFWKQTLFVHKPFLIGVEILIWSDCLLDISGYSFQ